MASLHIRWHLIFCIDSNIMNIKEQMCLQKRCIQDVANYSGRDRVNGWPLNWTKSGCFQNGNNQSTWRLLRG